MKTPFRSISLFLLLSGLTALPIAAQTVPTGLRLIAEAGFDANGPQLLVPKDSVWYNYPTTWTRNPSSTNSFEYYSGQRYPRLNTSFSYTAAGKVADATYDLYNSSTQQFQQNGKAVYTYDAQGNMTALQRMSWNKNTSAYVASTTERYVYNAAGKVTNYLQTINNSQTGSTDSVTRSTYTYNAQNEVVMTVMENYYRGGGGWKNAYLYKYVFNASGRGCLSDTMRVLDAGTGGWRNMYYTTYTLNAAGKPLSSFQRVWNTSTSSYDSMILKAYRYTPSGLEASVSRQDWYQSTGWIRTWKDSTTYNAFGQPVQVSKRYWGTTAYDAQGTERTYFYGPFIPAAVPAAAPAALRVTAGPNPARDVLDLQLEYTGSVSVMLMDLQGRVQQRFTAEAAGTFSRSVSVAGMPAGNYVLQVQGGGGSISKLITVSH